MNERTESRVEGWDSRPFTGGYAELREFADGGFSGVVRAGPAWLFMLNGRVVGVFGGAIEDFADAEGTAYKAPHPSLPLLFTMLEKGGEQQAKYYTNDTPISEAHRQLSDANFTGYIELSENVLSGDYYVVYYGGRSMSCAFVGNAERLVTGEEAFQLADDEVGIYEVRSVDIEVVDIPEPEGGSEPVTGPESEPEPEPEREAAGGEAAAAPPETAGGGDATAEGGAGAEAGAGTAASEPDGPASTEQSSGAGPDQEGSASPAAGSEPADPAADRTDAGADAAGAAEEDDGPAAEPASGTAEDAANDATAAGSVGQAADAGVGPRGVPKSEAAADDLRPIPSLSPDRTAVAEPGQEAAGERTADRAAEAPTADQATGTATADPAGEEPAADDAAGDGAAAGVDVDPAGGPEPVPEDADPAELRRGLEAREERIEELEAALTDLRVQRDGLRDERDRLQSEVERLEAEIADLEGDVERLRARLDEGPEGGHRLSPAEALTGTNLFVRYGSKGGGTLEKAHAGEVDREEVNTNLRLEHHTQFDADAAVVDGEDFETFLEGSIHRQFVEWVVRDLLYEIRDTGHVKGLKELYDAIPTVDRAEFLGEVSVQFTEDGEEYREQRSFDVVLRDRMGNPLVVANVNDSRSPVDREMMETTIDNAGDVRASNDSLAAAMMVTASFFEPGALEATDEVAGGGLLSRDPRKSFVRVARKAGYHLVLVESRDEEFHVNVPEL